MIKTKFVIFSEKRFTEADKEGILMAIKDLYKEKGIQRTTYIEEKVDV